MKIGLTLSGGGARGIAHIGMLKAMEEKGIAVDMISGVSSGAIVGALYAKGYSPDDMLKIVLEFKAFRFFKPAISSKGLLKMNKISALLKEYFPEDNFSHLKTPFTLAATDMERGKTAYFAEGDLIMPLLASNCLPLIFEPVKINGIFYADGGILNNLPCEPLLGVCDYLIGLHSNPVDENYQIKNARNMLERTFLLAINFNAYSRRQYFNLFLEPPLMKSFRVSDISRAKDIFEIGYHYASELLAQTDLPVK